MTADTKPGPRVLCLWTIGAAFLLSLWPACAQDHGDLVEQLKVAYIYNFTRFVDWPALPDGSPFVIGVIGDSGMAQSLRALEDRRADDRPIQVVRYPDVAALGRPQVLFVGRAAEPHLAEILRRTAGQPTLLVGDAPDYAARGVAIEFFLKADVFREKQKLRFRIARSALQGRGLAVSAQLMDVAEIVP